MPTGDPRQSLSMDRIAEDERFLNEIRAKPCSPGGSDGRVWNVPTPNYGDNVNSPPHYTSSDAKCAACGCPIECIDITRHYSFSIGNAIKYLWRAEHKGNAIEDLQKAHWYIQDEIEKRKNEG